jgi:hypothetical protein
MISKRLLYFPQKARSPRDPLPLIIHHVNMATLKNLHILSIELVEIYFSFRQFLKNIVENLVFKPKLFLILSIETIEWR